VKSYCSLSTTLYSYKKNVPTLLYLIGNADQTPAFYDMPLTVTVNKKGEKSVILRIRGNEKSEMTVMLSVLADGEETSLMCNSEEKLCQKKTCHLGSQ
jgi:hypothetical protein